MLVFELSKTDVVNKSIESWGDCRETHTFGSFIQRKRACVLTGVCIWDCVCLSHHCGFVADARRERFR